MARRKVRDDPRTEYERQKHFLQAYADTLSVTEAARTANIHRETHRRWLRKDPKYAAAFRKRIETAALFLEPEAITRAGEGWLEPVFYQGNECGQVRRFDSGLMQFLLRGLMPEKYGSKTEITGAQGAPIQAKIEVVFVRPSDTNNSTD